MLQNIRKNNLKDTFDIYVLNIFEHIKMSRFGRFTSHLLVYFVFLFIIFSKGLPVFVVYLYFFKLRHLRLFRLFNLKTKLKSSKCAKCLQIYF